MSSQPVPPSSPSGPEYGAAPSTGPKSWGKGKKAAIFGGGGCCAIIVLVFIIMVIVSIATGGGDDAPESSTTPEATVEATSEEAPDDEAAEAEADEPTESAVEESSDAPAEDEPTEEAPAEEESTEDEAPASEEPAGDDAQEWAEAVEASALMGSSDWQELCGGDYSLGICWISDVSADRVGKLDVTLQLTGSDAESQGYAEGAANSIFSTAGFEHEDLDWVVVYDAEGVVIDQWQRSDYPYLG